MSLSISQAQVSNGCAPVRMNCRSGANSNTVLQTKLRTLPPGLHDASARSMCQPAEARDNIPIALPPRGRLTSRGFCAQR